MKKRYFIQLSYQGKNYCGWQRQSNVISVQESIEQVLSKVLKTNITIHGCGRTDTGVHGQNYYAQMTTDATWEYDLVERLNWTLPEDIAIHAIFEVQPQASVQYHAIARTYRYYFHLDKHPKIANTSTWLARIRPDIDLIEKGLNILIGNHAFYAFCIRPEQYPNTTCHIHKAGIYPVEGILNAWYIEITANRFLQQMIRITVSKLWELGTGRISLETFKAAIEEQKTFKYHTSAPPQGLTLYAVDYNWEKILKKD